MHNSNSAPRIINLIASILFLVSTISASAESKAEIKSLKFNHSGNLDYIIFKPLVQKKPEININSQQQQLIIKLKATKFGKNFSFPAFNKDGNFTRLRYQTQPDELILRINMQTKPFKADYSYKNGYLTIWVASSAKQSNAEVKSNSAGSNSERNSSELNIYEISPFSVLEDREKNNDINYFAGNNKQAKQIPENSQKLFELYNSFSSQYDPLLNTALGRKVIVIDPGHGGVDQGSTGKYSRTKEKDVTLNYAKALRERLNNEGRYLVYLTRSQDRYLSLLQRIWIARQYKADLFISIHADSASSSKARGASVYTFSEIASDRAAANLARSQNQESFDGKEFVSNSEEKMVEEVLYGLITRHKRNSSSRFANKLIACMKSHSLIIGNGRRYGNFQVLRNGEIPAVLLELGYLSNREDEKILNNPKTKYEFANSIADSINQYFDEVVGG